MKNLRYLLYRSLNFFTVIVVSVQRLESEAILGGEFAKPGQFPYFVSIGAPKEICGGAILSDFFILSAAHCFFASNDMVKELPYEVTAGVVDLNEPNRIVIRVDKIYIPYDYDPKVGAQNDIAVLKLTMSLELNRRHYLKKIQFPENKDYLKTQAVVAGLGYEWVNRDRPQRGGDTGKLKFGQFTVVSNKECQQKYTGDSGSLLVLLGQDYKAIALVSLGPESCNEEDAPSVYTKIYPFLGFIKKAMSDFKDKRTRVMSDKYAIIYDFYY